MAEFEGELQQGPGLIDYLRVTRERWWIIVAAVIIAGGAAFFLSNRTVPLYRASASIVYQKSSLDTALLGAQLFASDYDPTRTIGTFVAVIGRNQSLSEAVRTELASSKSAAAFSGMVSVAANANTNLVAISAQSTDSKEAAAVANAFADQFIVYRRTADQATVQAAMDVVKQQIDSLTPAEVQGNYGLMLQEKYETLRILESMQTGGFSIVSAAGAPGAPFTPQTNRNIVLGLVVGLVVGIGLVFLMEYLDRRIKDDKTLERLLSAPVLAVVPSIGGRWRGAKGKRSSKPVGFARHHSLLEPFRTLRSSLQYFSIGKDNPVWLITSGLPQEGKTVTTVNLALSLALSGKRVIVIEADLRKPMVHEYLKLERGPGLSDVLAGTHRAIDVLQLVQADEYLPASGRRQGGDAEAGLMQRNLYVMTSGSLPPNPAELLASDRMASVISELSQMTDCVVIDTPPVLMVSDALSLAQYADGIIVTARLRATNTDEVRELRNLLSRSGARVIGSVAQGSKSGSGYYYRRGYHGHYYRYGYSGYGGYGYGGYGSQPEDK